MSLQVFGCPDCEQPFKVDSSQAGQQVRCPGCSAVVEIPAAVNTPPVTESIAAPTAPESQEVPQAFACPSCESAFGVLASMFGTTMACPHCGQAVSIEHATPSPAPKIDVQRSAATKPSTAPISTPKDDSAAFAPPIQKKTAGKQKRPNKSAPTSDTAAKPPIADVQGKPTDQSNDRAVIKAPPRPTGDAPTTGLIPSVDLNPLAESAEPIDLTEEVPAFVPQSVDHLLPPRFATLDPAFFYRRGNSQDQVLLPQADGSVQAVSNRIVTVVHNGQEYELISSPRYRRNLDIVVNAILMLVAAVLMVAIWWAVA